ncbi:hypothetical protein C0989_010770 [Termitomyces sp. Mn162]|nr:hypothetical protein C0989_010770 [Termitomyces sp. Mn162]
MAIDKQTGFDIVNPTSSLSALASTPFKTTNSERKHGAIHFAHVTPIHCEDYALPSQVIALVREQIEGLLLEEILIQKDTQAKLTYADQFLTELPKTMDRGPNHIYH